MPEPVSEGLELTGLGVLVTRPAPQSQPLCELIRSAGGRPLCFPALEIRPARRQQIPRELLQGLEGFALAIFISSNAVRYGLQLIGNAGDLPPGLELAAVGEATARSLAEAGHPPSLVPEGRYDSEALLATPRLKRVLGQRILIIRGEGGRAWLGDVLRQRGAEVVYAEVYRRACPDVRADNLVSRWAEVDVVTATSNETLDNLVHLFGPAHLSLLQRTPLLVVSERMQIHARRLGFQRPLRAKRASDRAILEALIEYKAGLVESPDLKG